jgi:hypothetical protein
VISLGRVEYASLSLGLVAARVAGLGLRPLVSDTSALCEPACWGASVPRGGLVGVLAAVGRVAVCPTLGLVEIAGGGAGAGLAGAGAGLAGAAVAGLLSGRFLSSVAISPAFRQLSEPRPVDRLAPTRRQDARICGIAVRELRRRHLVLLLIKCCHVMPLRSIAAAGFVTTGRSPRPDSSQASGLLQRMTPAWGSC